MSNHNLSRASLHILIHSLNGPAKPSMEWQHLKWAQLRTQVLCFLSKTLTTSQNVLWKGREVLALTKGTDS